MTGKGEHPEGSDAFYVYCIAEAIAAEQIAAESLPTAIEDDAAVELIAVSGLAAVVSRVPLASYGEESLTEHLTDATWTAVRAMRHQQVVEHFSRRTSVVPLRFGTIYLQLDGVERMLTERKKELADTIDRLRGREEWGINLFCDRKILATVIDSLSPRLRELAEQSATASPGQSYLMRKKIEALRTDECRVELNHIASEVDDTFRALCDDAKRLRILKVEATEHGELIAKFAFLIKRSSFEEFRATAERLARKHEQSGVRLELTGPWPAYNFAGDS
jgi:hypothetical protein